MSLRMVWLYAVILLLLAVALWGACRVLGTPSRLAPRDYDVVLADVRTSVGRAADRLRLALVAGPDGRLEDEAGASGPRGPPPSSRSSRRRCWTRLAEIPHRSVKAGVERRLRLPAQQLFDFPSVHHR